MNGGIIMLRSFLLFCCLAGMSLAAWGDYQKFVYVYDQSGDLLLPKNPASQCPDPAGESSAAQVCHGVLVDENGNYSVRLDSQNISLSNLVFIANEYEFIPAGTNGNSEDVYALVDSKRRIDTITKDATNNGVNINDISEATVTAVEKVKHVPKGKKGHIITELADVIDEIDCHKLNHAMGNSQEDNAPQDQEGQRINDYVTAQQQRLDENQQQTLVSLAQSALEHEDDQQAQALIRKNVVQGLVEPATLSEVATRVFSHISDLQIADGAAPLLILEADKYLVYFNESAQLSTADSVNANRFFAYTWQGVTSETSSATFAKAEQGSYLVCATGEIDGSSDSSTDCIRIAVKDQVEAVARANRLRVGTGNLVKLSASLSIGAQSYLWTGSGTFTGATAETTMWTAPETPGTYEITLGINNNEDTDRLTITVFDVLPVAVAAASPYVAYLQNQSATSTLSSGSIATDGSAVDSLEWSITDYPTGAQAIINNTSAKITQFTTDTPGDYTIELLATRRSYTDTAQINIQVRDPAKPRANAGDDQVTYRNQAVMLDGSRSYASEGRTLSYLWSTTGASLDSPAQTTTHFVTDTLGSYNVTLNVDDGLQTDSDSLTVAVVNRAPAASDDVYANLLNVILYGQLIAMDPDRDTLTYSLVQEPSSGGVTIDPVNGEFVYVPGGIKGCKYHPFTRPEDNDKGGKDVPVIKLCADRYVIAPGETVNLTASNSINASKFSGYEWLGGAVGDTDDIRLATYTGTTEGLQQVCVKGNIGQSNNTSTACVDIIVNPNLNPIDDDVATGYVDKFTYKVGDGGEYSNIATVIITIGWQNTPAEVSDLDITTQEDVATGGQLQGSDLDGHDITFSIVDNPTTGSVTLDNATSGAFTYTPNPDANGVDTFTYVANDGFENSQTSTVTITVESTNDAPVAHFTGILTTLEDNAVAGMLGVTDPDEGDVMDFRLATLPSKGEVVITNAQTGAFTYTPRQDLNGSDSFFFVVHDGEIESNAARVDIDITPVNDPPLTEDVGPLTTHTDETLSGTLTGSDVDKDALVYKIESQPAKGSVTLDAVTGQYVYTPGGSTGNDSFTYSASDAYVASNASTVSIDILPTNHAPVCSQPAPIEDVLQGVAYGGSFNCTDSDGDAITYIIVDKGHAGSAAFTNASTGEFQYTSNPLATGADYFTFIASDGDKKSEPVTVQVIVNAVCQGPGNDKRDSDNDGYADFVETEFGTGAGSTPYSLISQGVTKSFVDDDDSDAYADITELWMGLSNYKDGNSVPSHSTLSGVPSCFTPMYDAVPPVLFAFHIMTPTIDATTGDAKARFALTALDNAAGVAEVSIQLKSPSGETVNGKATYTDKAVVAYVEFESDTFSQYAETGTWTVAKLAVKDAAGNQLLFSTADLQSRYYDSTLSVTGATPPEVLQNFQILTPSVDVCNGETIASVQVLAEEAVSGIARIAVVLNSPSGSVFNWGEIIRSDLPNTLTATINTQAYKIFSESGQWAVAELSITNGAGDVFSFGSDELDSKGYQTAIDVTTCPPEGLMDFRVLTPIIDLDSTEKRAKFAVKAAYTQGINEISVELQNSKGELIQVSHALSASPDSVDISFESEAFACHQLGTWSVKTVSIIDGNNQLLSWSKPQLQQPDYNFTVDDLVVSKSQPCGGIGHILKAYGGSIQTDEDTVYTGDDTDNDGDGVVNSTLKGIDELNHSLTYTVVEQGTLGRVIITDHSTGAFNYTPLADVYGEDRFTFKVSDGYGDSNTATINVTVNPVPDPTEIVDLATDDPAADLLISVEYGTTYYGNVSATDADQLPLTYEIIDQGAYGAATFLTNNAFKYEPQTVPGPMETLEDTFTFQVHDENSISRIGTVKVTIRPVDAIGDPPITVLTPKVTSCAREDVVADSVTITAEVTLAKAASNYSRLLINLEGPSGQAIGFLAYPQGSGTKVTIQSSVQKSSLNETGIWSFKNLLVKRQGDENYKLIMDDFGEAGQLEVVYNCAPVANDSAETVLINQLFEGELTATDPEGDSLTFSILDQSTGIVTPLSDVQFDANSGIYKLAYSYAPTSLDADTIKFIANDGLSDSNIGQVAMNIVIDPCPISHDLQFDTAINQVLQDTLFGYNPANPPGNNLMFEIINPPSLGTLALVDNASGAFRYHPRQDTVGTDSFTYRVSNGECVSQTTTVTVRVAGSIAPDDSITVIQNVPYSGQLDSGNPNPDGLVFKLVGTTTNTLKTGRGTVMLTDPTTGTYTFTPDKDVVGPDNFQFNVMYGTGASPAATVTVSIIPQPNCRRSLSNGYDTDGDGYVDYIEVVMGTDPEDAGSTPADIDPKTLGVSYADDDDGDGYNDNVELWLESDPLNADSIPEYVSEPCFDNTSDGIKPILIGFNIDTPTVDISGASTVVTYSMSLLDNASGIKRARVSLLSPSGVFVTTSASFTDYPLLTGITLDSEPLSEFAEEGAWEVSGITLYDEAGNRLDITHDDLVNAGYPASLTVVNTNSDITPPTLDDFTILTSDIVYAGTEDKRMSVSLTFSDDSSGVASARVDFISASGTVVSASQTLAENPASTVIQLDTGILSSHLEEGIWTVYGVLLVDAAGNSAQVVDQLAAKGFPGTLMVTNPNTDSVAPTLESFSVLTGQVFPLSGSTEMSFAVTAYDTALNANSNSPSGIEKIRIDIMGPAGQVLIAWGYLTAPYPATTTIQIDTVKLSSLTQEGTWQVTGVEVFDDAGNSTLYDETDLSGYPTSILVSH